MATFEWSSFRLFSKIPKSDLLIIVIVSITTVIIDLAIAVFVGVILAALIFAWEQGKKVSAKTTMSKNGFKTYTLTGSLFFGSANSFKELFSINEDPNHVVIDFKQAKVLDHSGIEAIQNITDRYGSKQKKLHLMNLSADCEQLLNKADTIVELSIYKEKKFHIADDLLD